MSLVKTASKVSGGLDNGYRNRMVRNVVIEVAIGLIPLLGDFIDTFYQANTRNVVLLEAMLTARVQKLQDAEKAGTGTGIAPTREGTRTTRHHNDDSRTATPQNYDDRHAGMHKRLQAKEHQDPARSTHASEADGGNRWLNRFQSRGKSTAGSEDGAPARPPRPAQSNVVYDRMSDEDLAPARPPRHGTSRHHPVGSF